MALLSIAAALALGVAGCGAGDSEYPIDTLAWQPCSRTDQAGFLCATARVPVDHSNPLGPRLNLAVVKHVASDPARRLGVLFFNPGGPGGAGSVDLPLWLEAYFPAELRQRFDLISFDPRGVGASTAVLCFDSAEQSAAFQQSLPGGYPVGEEQIDAWNAAYRELARRCAERRAALLPHLSTADVARDMDWLRQAAGQERLNYLGVSYGTLLGATYANLFPRRVAGMVLDGNVDPVAWHDSRAGLSTSLRIRSDLASARTLQRFLELCGAASVEACAFSAGTPAATLARFEALLARLAAAPLALPQGPPLTAARLSDGMNSLLFVVEAGPGFPGWVAAARLLRSLFDALDASSALGAGSGADSGAATASADDPPAFIAEQALAVICGDSPNPRDSADYAAQGALALQRAGAAGLPWSWGDSPCAVWPAQADKPYRGPWNAATAQPALVIGSHFDPSTAYENAQVMASSLAGARLLTIDGWGHTALLNPNRCATAHVVRYFVTAQLPPVGAVCSADQLPFR